MANWVGHADRGSIRKLLMRAITRSEASKGNRQIRVIGEVQRTWTFTGPYFRLEGRIDCLYYGQNVLSVDFINKRITDRGWHAYNSCTNQTIRGYEDVILGLFSFALPSKHIRWVYTSWMNPPDGDTPYGRFASRMPWVKDGWFLWEHYDPVLADVFHEGERDLRETQNWRWFTYDWDQYGIWAKRFINADAERRFRKKEKYRCRRSLKATKSTSSTPSTQVATPKPSMLPCENTTRLACPTGMVASSSSLG